jgi:hypothetical protein
MAQSSDNRVRLVQSVDLPPADPLVCRAWGEDPEAEVVQLETEVSELKQQMADLMCVLRMAKSRRNALRQKTCPHTNTKCIQLRGIGTIGGVPAFADKCTHCGAIVERHPIEHDMGLLTRSSMEAW